MRVSPALGGFGIALAMWLLELRGVDLPDWLFYPFLVIAGLMISVSIVRYARDEIERRWPEPYHPPTEDVSFKTEGGNVWDRKIKTTARPKTLELFREDGYQTTVTEFDLPASVPIGRFGTLTIDRFEEDGFVIHYDTTEVVEFTGYAWHVYV